MNWTIKTLSRCDSTQAALINSIESDKDTGFEGHVIRAVEQANGTGRYNRKWVMERGDLAFSFAIKPQAPLQHWSSLSLVAGVALGRVLKAYGWVRLKWPNDVLFASVDDSCDLKKCAGILCDVVGEYFVIGIGVNIVRTNKPDEYAYIGTNANAEPLMKGILQEFLSLYRCWCDNKFSVIMDEWQALGPEMDSNIQLKQGRQIIKGRYNGLGDDGALLLRLENGAIKTVNAGELIT